MSFMYGRYGVDELYYGLFGLWLALIIVNMFVRSYIIYLLETAVIIYSLWRMLSKKKDKRRRENEAFLKLWNPTKSWFILQKQPHPRHKRLPIPPLPEVSRHTEAAEQKGEAHHALPEMRR